MKIHFFRCFKKAPQTIFVLGAFLLAIHTFAKSPALKFRIVPEHTRLDTGPDQISAVVWVNVPKGYYVPVAPFLGSAESGPQFQLESLEKSLSFSGAHFPAPQILVQKNGARTTGFSQDFGVYFIVNSTGSISKKTSIKFSGKYTLCSIQKGCRKQISITPSPTYEFNLQKWNQESSDPASVKQKLPDTEIQKIIYTRKTNGDFAFSLPSRLAKVSGVPELIPDSDKYVDFNRPSERNGFEIILKPQLGLDPQALPFIEGLLVFPDGTGFRVNLEALGSSSS